MTVHEVLLASLIALIVFLPLAGLVSLYFQNISSFVAAGLTIITLCFTAIAWASNADISSLMYLGCFIIVYGILFGGICSEFDSRQYRFLTRVYMAGKVRRSQLQLTRHESKHEKTRTYVSVTRLDHEDWRPMTTNSQATEPVRRAIGSSQKPHN